MKSTPFKELKELYVRALRITQSNADPLSSCTFEEIDLQEKCGTVTEDEALALFVDAKLTKQQYSLIRDLVNAKCCNLFPSYKKLAIAKKRCYPKQEHITITSTGIDIKLQSLLDHTAERILQTKTDEELKDHRELVLISKWGCDGSSGFSEYKQKTEESYSDSSIFCISLVPIQLNSILLENVIVWSNCRPSSTRYCRPIKFEYAKETDLYIKNQVAYIQNQIQDLLPSNIIIHGINYKVNHKLVLTMVDGKVCNSLADNKSSQSCYICKAKPTQMNLLDVIKQKPCNEDYYAFGLSTLHCWIRFLECILHLSYKIPIKKWQARGPEDQKIVEATKKKIQNNIKEKLGLKVDIPKQGTGTTNDGNTARRFFQQPSLAAEITGVNEELVKRFAIILQTLSCGRHINIGKFESFAYETAQLFVTEYKWYYMPASVHKVLLHGSSVIKVSLLPIGQLSEEAQEARNKDIKKIREFNTRKCSRQATNEDLVHSLLVSSDPFVTNMRYLKPKKESNLCPEAIALLEQITDTDSDSLNV